MDGAGAFTDYTLLRRRDFVYDGPRELVDTQDCTWSGSAWVREVSAE